MLEVEKRITALEESVSTLLKHIKDINFAVASGFEKVDKNFETVIEDIKAIRGRSRASLETVEVKLEDLTAEIKKINDVSGYDDIFANNKGLKIVSGR
ncbi:MULTISPECIES: hypothetical protein [Pedobacter]|uniref:hypothetical protein n=1 Tax=Pedobacter TaxID=84567 RepID=UPI00210C0C27|nr:MULTISPECIES: hypothetical protein [unclassified Pedobacter]